MTAGGKITVVVVFYQQVCVCACVSRCRAVQVWSCWWYTHARRAPGKKKKKKDGKKRSVGVKNKNGSRKNQSPWRDAPAATCTPFRFSLTLFGYRSCSLSRGRWSRTAPCRVLSIVESFGRPGFFIHVCVVSLVLSMGIS